MVVPLSRPSPLSIAAVARQQINLSWLIRLRWGAVIGQFVAILAAYGLWHVALPLQPLLCVLGLTAGSNMLVAGAARRGRFRSEHWLGALMACDLLLLTALLYYSGGSTNPFNFLYLIHIALAAVTLRARWVVGLMGLAFVCFVGLFGSHLPLAVAGAPALSPALDAQGKVVAFALAAAFIVYFVHRVTRDLASKEAELGRARDLSARNERLTSLATLAAGAAHELATPLGTIAVVSRELELQLGQRMRRPNSAGEGDAGLGALCEDAQLIRHQVERCRSVLQHMAADAGASHGEPLACTATESLLQAALVDLPQRQRVSLVWSGPARRAWLRIPERSISQAVRAVIKNALEASSALSQSPVEVRIGLEGADCAIVVRDAGHGMDPDVLARVSEPFFTTKAPGDGMGLGLFLTRTVLERLGGSLHVDSVLHGGTTVTLKLPVAVEGPPKEAMA